MKKYTRQSHGQFGLNGSTCRNNLHPWTAENISISQGVRSCRQCRRERERVRRMLAEKDPTGWSSGYTQDDLVRVCRNGHPRTKANTLYWKSAKYRRCKLCVHVQVKKRPSRAKAHKEPLPDVPSEAVRVLLRDATDPRIAVLLRELGA